MSKYVIEDTTLTSIADAVREKSGTSELIKVSDIPTAIAGIPSGGESNRITKEDLSFSGDLERFNSNGLFDDLFDKNRDWLSFTNVTNLNFFFSRSLFDFGDVTIGLGKVNKSNGTWGYSFRYYNGTSLPALIGTVGASNGMAQYPFSDMENLVHMDGVFDQIDWSYHDANYTSSGYYNCIRDVFNNLPRLRRLPTNFLEHCDSTNTWGNIYVNLCNYCYSLDEAVDLPVFDNQYMRINGGFSENNHLARMTFATNEDGTPIVVSNWEYNHVLNLSNRVGYGNFLPSYFSSSKEVKDDATYQALKNDPDWWTKYVAYSRYNHDSAVETINSLPDASGIRGYTFTVKFTGAAGSATDGGAINTLTETEIAVATAKGWTLSLT